MIHSHFRFGGLVIRENKRDIFNCEGEPVPESTQCESSPTALSKHDIPSDRLGAIFRTRKFKIRPSSVTIYDLVGIADVSPEMNSAFILNFFIGGEWATALPPSCPSINSVEKIKALRIIAVIALNFSITFSLLTIVS